MSVMTPKEIVHELDQYIISQSAAKRAVANALRNRWRRLQLSPELREEVTPKNILLIGPTGVGKTEIARRLAKFAGAPFLKVEATKFTEIGYVGRDVESIIRDLSEVTMNMLRAQHVQKVAVRAQRSAEQRILSALETAMRKNPDSVNSLIRNADNRREVVDKLRAGELDEVGIDIELATSAVDVQFMAPPGMEEVIGQLQGMFSNLASNQKSIKNIKVKDAVRRLGEEEAAALINEEKLRSQVVETVEQKGIVFIDEIDKVARHSEHRGADVSREGVQRDLLPLVEGCAVSTKYGVIRTDHILFIASGAFHLSKPSDLIPELQGRLPVRVPMDALTPEDFKRILTEPKSSLIKQYKALIETEGLRLEFLSEAVDELAKTAWRVNENTENIGARRLHTVMERLLENLFFEAPEMTSSQGSEPIVIDLDYVKAHLEELSDDQDLSRFIL